jgi:aminopeptidase N
MWQRARQIAAFDTSERGKPMVNRNLADPDDIYTDDGGKVYYKGGWVLHMLRHQLGETVFWRGVAKYLNDHRWQAVETSDLRRALEEVSGRDLEQFFQQWIYGHGVPRLEVDYAWDGLRKRVNITVRQTQKIDAATPAFHTPLDLYFRAAGQDKYVTVELSEARHEFHFDFVSEPVMFGVDPNGGLLKSLAVKMPRALLRETARNGPTALARLMAAEQLEKEAGPDTIQTLAQILQNVSEFWMVRQAAAAVLGKMQTEEGLRALLQAAKQNLGHPRVLAAVVEALGGYIVSAEAHAAVLSYADPNSPLYVELAAMHALGRMRASPDLVSKSLEALQKEARPPARRAVRSAALAALAAREDSRCYDLVFELAQPGRNDLMRDQAITLLGHLGRQESLRERTRNTLTSWLYDPDRSAQAAAIAGLGDLADPRSLTDLERIRASARPESLRKAAQRAMADIARAPDPRQTAIGLAQRLGAIEKQNQELERKLKEMADKLEAMKQAKKQP